MENFQQETNNYKDDINKVIDLSVIIPVKDESASIKSIVVNVLNILKKLGKQYEILVIDDGSTDNSGNIAEEAGATVIRHPYCIGNGAAIKTGIRNANGAVLLMMDGDGQHNPEDIPRLLHYLPEYDMVVGARSNSSETRIHRDLANKMYNLFAGYVCNFKIKDLTSGFKAIKSDIATSFLNLLPNTFSCPTTLTLALIRSGFSIKYISIETNTRKGKSKIKLIKDGIRFFNIILRISVLFAPLRVFVPIATCIFSMGFFWYVYSVFFGRGKFPPMSIVVIITSVIIFFLGLISDQITQLRYEKKE
ncbi:MAG: glycosyltransferase family 2 protein [Desulfobacterales bacterium]|nr:glycosyltransferase family 2 protein [Desulfobacterales bacterium]